MSLFFKVAHLPIPRKDLEKSPDISPKQEINEKKYIDVEKPDSEQEQQKHSPIHFLNQLFSEESKSQIDNSFYNLPKLESNIDTLKRNLIEEDHLPNSTPESKELSIENEDLLNERKYIETASGFIKKLKNEEEIESIIIEKNQKEDKDQINKNKEYRKKRKTKYREHKIYRNLWVFFPDDYFKQRWDILILR